MSLSKKILVTGGLGYIGSHTVIELVDSGFEPVIVDNFSNTHEIIVSGLAKILKRNIPIHYFDCADYSFMKQLFLSERFYGVIHFASYKNVNESISEPLKYYQNNINSLLTVLKVMKELRTTNLVFSSSCAVYGDAEVLPVKECSPILIPKSPYGNTKKICEEIIYDNHRAEPNFKSIILRYFNPIGAHDSGEIGEFFVEEPSNLLPILMQHATSGKGKFKIHGNNHPTPDGTCIRDFIHISDLAKSHVKAFQHLENNHLPENYHNVFNIGTGKGCSILDFIQIFEAATNISLDYEIGPARRGDISQMYADAQKASNLLQWHAEKTVEDAIKDAWNWNKNPHLNKLRQSIAKS